MKIKKYFYVLRPVLACKWILEKQTPPPMSFFELMESELEPELQPVVEKLLDIKMHTPEVKQIPRVDVLNGYLEKNIEEVKAQIQSLPAATNAGWEPLNRLFCDTVFDVI